MKRMKVLKRLLPLLEEMFTFVYNCSHLNFQIKHFDQQKSSSDCPLNQNQNAGTSVMFVPMEH